jgi:phage antirepressor YoqD-like protein
MYEIVKSEMFCGNQCDFYESDNNEILMTSTQLGSCLGYSNPQKAIDNLISRNEYLKNIEFSVTLKMRATDGKQYNTRLFTEDGIYEITMLSKTDKARHFRAFVREAIKSIRKHGMYATDELLENPDLAIQVFQKLKEERLERKRLEAENQIMKPKADYFDDLVDRNTLTSFRETAKELRTGERKFINFLLNNGYLYRDKKGKLMPYAEKNNGLFEVKESKSAKTTWSGIQTFVTVKGRETFRLLMK